MAAQEAVAEAAVVIGGLNKQVGAVGSQDVPDVERTHGGLCDCDLALQNSAYAGTGGVSPNNRAAGFFPAYQNRATGEAVISRFADGSPAPVHVLDGLPGDWVAVRDETGRACRAVHSVVAGFLRDGVFYTREAAAQWLAEVAHATGR